MKKFLITVVVSLFVMIVLIFSFNCKRVTNKDSITAKDEKAAEPYLTNLTEETENVYDFLGHGFNIGNSLDVCDWNNFGSVSNSGFQAGIVYNTEPWTAWDVSDYYFFDSEDEVNISWDLSGLKSEDSVAASNFAIQLVNHDKAYEGLTVNCTIKKLELRDANGSLYDLLSSKPEIHQLFVKDEVTNYIYINLSHLNISTSDLRDLSLFASLEISDYYRNKKTEIASLEKAWGNPEISLELIETIKIAGFDTVRIPVTYFNHISNDGTIDTEFLDRVEEVVDWIIDKDMYCIIDIHHDSGNDGWIKASATNYEKNHKIVTHIIKQIAERFKGKDNHLILEGLNETVNDDTQWSNIPVSDIQIMNKWNQLFVDAVRSTGGNNTDRVLLVNTYAALPLDECLKNFVLPNDIVKDKIYVGIHCYFKHEDLDKSFSVIDTYSSKYRFVIGEWGFDKSIPDRASAITDFVYLANERSIPIIYWDNGDCDTMGILNRTTYDWEYAEVVRTITGK